MKIPGRLHLSVQLATRRPIPDRSQVRRWVASALVAAEQTSVAEIVVRFCDSREGRQLNHQYRGRDYATNVLTFSHDRPDLIAADIVLCVPVLEREARTQRKSVKNHMAHLVVHGVLHALGYDHDEPGNAQTMEALETAILSRFSIPDPYLG